MPSRVTDSDVVLPARVGSTDVMAWYLPVRLAAGTGHHGLPHGGDPERIHQGAEGDFPPLAARCGGPIRGTSNTLK